MGAELVQAQSHPALDGPVRETELGGNFGVRQLTVIRQDDHFSLAFRKLGQGHLQASRVVSLEDHLAHVVARRGRGDDPRWPTGWRAYYRAEPGQWRGFALQSTAMPRRCPAADGNLPAPSRATRTLPGQRPGLGTHRGTARRRRGRRVRRAGRRARQRPPRFRRPQGSSDHARRRRRTARVQTWLESGAASRKQSSHASPVSSDWRSRGNRATRQNCGPARLATSHNPDVEMSLRSHDGVLAPTIDRSLTPSMPLPRIWV